MSYDNSTDPVKYNAYMEAVLGLGIARSFLVVAVDQSNQIMQFGVTDNDVDLSAIGTRCNIMHETIVQQLAQNLADQLNGVGEGSEDTVVEEDEDEAD